MVNDNNLVFEEMFSKTRCKAIQAKDALWDIVGLQENNFEEGEYSWDGWGFSPRSKQLIEKTLWSGERRMNWRQVESEHSMMVLLMYNTDQ